jgi:hypothetical protein
MFVLFPTAAEFGKRTERRTTAGEPARADRSASEPNDATTISTASPVPQQRKGHRLSDLARSRRH